VVEHFNTFIKIRQDLYGFIDILCVGTEGTLAIQATSDNGGNVAKRVQKIADSDKVAACRDAGWKIEVHGWKKVKNRWQVRVIDVS